MSNLLLPPVFTAIITILVPLGVAFVLLSWTNPVKVLGIEIPRGRLPRWLAPIVGAVLLGGAVAGMFWVLRQTSIDVRATDLSDTETLPSWLKINDPAGLPEPLNRIVGTALTIANAGDLLQLDQDQLKGFLRGNHILESIQDSLKKDPGLMMRPYVFICHQSANTGSVLWNAYAPQRWELVEGINAKAVAINLGLKDRPVFEMIGKPLPPGGSDAVMLVWGLDRSTQALLESNTNGVFITRSIARRP